MLVSHSNSCFLIWSLGAVMFYMLFMNFISSLCLPSPALSLAGIVPLDIQRTRISLHCSANPTKH